MEGKQVLTAIVAICAIVALIVMCSASVRADYAYQYRGGYYPEMFPIYSAKVSYTDVFNRVGYCAINSGMKRAYMPRYERRWGWEPTYAYYPMYYEDCREVCDEEFGGFYRGNCWWGVR